MSGPRLTVCVGGGGVGKTTTSSALALALARSGRRTLVMTVDPARRLADALGIQVGQKTQIAPICMRAEGRLEAKMPDPRSSMTDFMLWLFEDPVQRARVMENPAVKELADSLAGVHEVLTFALLQTEIDSGSFEEIILDTAPSRHALTFLAYPERIVELLEAKAMTWLASVAPSMDAPRKTGFFAWGRAKVEGLFGRVMGVQGLRDLSALFAELISVRQRWADLARRTHKVLKDSRTRYYLVGAPTSSAVADVLHLAGALGRRKLHPTAIVLNRAESDVPPHERRLTERLIREPELLGAEGHEALTRTLAELAEEHRARSRAALVAERAFAIGSPRTKILRLPYVGPRPPRDIVLALADAWEFAGL